MKRSVSIIAQPKLLQPPSPGSSGTTGITVETRKRERTPLMDKAKKMMLR